MKNKDKFRINREKINQIISEYQALGGAVSEEQKLEFQQRITAELGTEGFKQALRSSTLTPFLDNLLKGEQAHKSYSNDEFFQMIEGLSNYEIVGDWQQFLTVDPDYIYNLPKKEQEKFAANFSIGNKDLKECLLALWGQRVNTSGVDLIRDSKPQSVNYICFQPNSPEDIAYMAETLCRALPSKDNFIFQYVPKPKEIEAGIKPILVVESLSTDIFKTIGNIAPLLGQAQYEHVVPNRDNTVKDSYWDLIVRETEDYGTVPIAHISSRDPSTEIKREKLERELLERHEELAKSQGNILSDFKTLITSRNKDSEFMRSVSKMSGFFGKIKDAVLGKEPSAKEPTVKGKQPDLVDLI